MSHYSLENELPLGYDEIDRIHLAPTTLHLDTLRRVGQTSNKHGVLEVLAVEAETAHDHGHVYMTYNPLNAAVHYDMIGFQHSPGFSLTNTQIHELATAVRHMIEG